MKPVLKKYRDTPENRRRLFDFYRSVYSTMAEMADDSHFQWRTYRNPAEDGEERPLIWYLESAEGEIVGHNSIFRYPLRIDGREYTGYCSTNLIVKPGTEGRGLGHILIENNEKLNGVPFAYGPTPPSLSAFQKRGWVALYDARLHTLMLHPVPALRFLRKLPWQVWAAALPLKLLAWILGLSRILLTPAKIEGISIREVSRFEADWDIYWGRYLEKFGLHYIRRHDFLNYKYAARDDARHHILIFENQECPVGYAVYRVSVHAVRGVRLGRVVDLVYDPLGGRKLASYMMRVAVDRLLKEKVDCVVAVSCSDESRRAYRENGLILSRPQIMLVKETDFRIADIRHRYKYIWHLTLGDADIDSYW